MSRVLCHSNTLFRSLSLSQHVNKSISNLSCRLLQQRLSTQTYTRTAQYVSKPRTVDTDQLYQRAKRLVEARRNDIVEYMMTKSKSKEPETLHDSVSNHMRFPKPGKCRKAEDRLSGTETDLERDVFLLSLITTVVRPKEVISMQELIDRLTKYQEALDKYEFQIQIALDADFLEWLLQPRIKRYISLDIPGANYIVSMNEKRRMQLMVEALSHSKVQWNGVPVERMVNRFDAEDYGLKGFPSEAILYLPHVSVTAKEAKEGKLSSGQLQKLNEEIMHYYETSRLSESDVAASKRESKRIESTIRRSLPEFKEIVVDLFGSVASGLASHGCDVDLCVSGPILDRIKNEAENKNILRIRISELISEFGRILGGKGGMENVVTVKDARVPVVKFYDPLTKIKCDLSIYNPAAMRSTELLKAYAQADPRVAPLVFAVKYWARYRKLIDPYHRDDMINSYTHTLMLLAFLMMERVIPPLQQICCDQPIKDHLEASHQKHEGEPTCLACQRPLPTDMIESYNTYFYTGVPSPSPNTKTVGELLVDFFRFYAFEFSYSKDCVSPRMGGVISRDVKGWKCKDANILQGAGRIVGALCVEDPFILDQDCTATLVQRVVSGVRWEHERALRALLSGRGLKGAATLWTRWDPAVYQKLNVYQSLK